MRGKKTYIPKYLKVKEGRESQESGMHTENAGGRVIIYNRVGSRTIYGFGGRRLRWCEFEPYLNHSPHRRQLVFSLSVESLLYTVLVRARVIKNTS